MIVQELHAIQHRHGFLPAEELRALAARTGSRLHRLQEVASFFPHFHLEPPPQIRIRICQDMSCQLRGACELINHVKEVGKTHDGLNIDVAGVSCLGRCDRAPAVSISSLFQTSEVPTADEDSRKHEELDRYYTNLDQSKLDSLIRKTVAAVNSRTPGNLPAGEKDDDWRPEQAKSWTIDPYRGKPDEQCYQGIRQLIARRWTDPRDADWQVDKSVKENVEKALGGSLDKLDLESQRIICSLFTANLLGMGGAGGRAYKKWFEVYEAAGDVKYVVCNGDESEPGTFKDREILVRAPHLVVEGVILAGLILGAHKGYIYIRHEFAEQIEAVRLEIERAKRLRLCGQGILGTRLNFSVEVFISPGGYICGEQTALIEAMEDKRAEPRNRPPELQTNGLWNCPTLLNNVETLAWVPAIILGDNGLWFANQGRNNYLGRRFFSISGDVAKPGAYEVSVGITLRELIDDYAGGMAAGKQFKAAALSGPSGGFVPHKLPVEYLRENFVTKKLPPAATHFDILDMELDIQTARGMGIMMGAGIVIFGDQTDMVATALSCTEFYRNESCGKCVPCRVGSQKLVELLTNIADRKYSVAEIYGKPNDAHNGKRGLINDLAETMKLTAICGLGVVASNPLTTLLDHFRPDVERYTRK